MVDRLPLVVVVVFVVHCSVNYWLTQVDEEEHWDAWEHKAHIVPRQTDVQDAVATE